MLLNIDPILNPKLLFTLREMGHGDTLLLCDANFPAYSSRTTITGFDYTYRQGEPETVVSSLYHSKEIIRLDGVNIGRATEAILSVFPLDGFSSTPIIRMVEEAKNPLEMPGGGFYWRGRGKAVESEENEVHKEFTQAVHKIAGTYWRSLSYDREEFYIIAQKSYAIVTTTDPRPYGCFILTKGVLDAEGKVMVRDEEKEKFVSVDYPVNK